MINGAHVLVYSSNADADRAFVRDVLGFRFVDVGHGWLIFGLPPSELAVHPNQGGPLTAELYLMCDDVRAEIESLRAKGVTCAPITEERWGFRTAIRLPSGSELGLYQPTHPTANR
jgi:catechol 2,3-dioxygenase-like lactoylglutathione lyase family enzyme